MTIEEMKKDLEFRWAELRDMQQKLEVIQAGNHTLATNLRNESKIVEGKIQLLNEMTPVIKIT